MCCNTTIVFFVRHNDKKWHGSIEQAATITGVRAGSMTIDANYPLAGNTLTVAGKVIDVRNAVQKEITLGRVSGQDDSTLLLNITMRSQKDTR